MAIPSEREALRQTLNDLAATQAPPPYHSDVALAGYCRRQLTYRRLSLGLLGLGLLAAVIILTIGWRSGRIRLRLRPHGRHAGGRPLRRI